MNQAVFPVQALSGHRFDALRRWEAQLRLELVAYPSGEGRRTELYRNQARGPLHVQRPFWPEGQTGACHLYVLHPPGGLVSGDALSIEVQAASHSRTLLTTPSANRLYKSDRNAVPWSQYTRLNVAEGAIVEYLPQETIAFDGTRGHQHLRMDVASGGTVIGWELLGLGRPAGEQPFVSGA
ncbi:MAG: urease accessory protein UreD, partial [Gammaproteobacteria bacterium]